jgi:rod shape-determining protein MreC
MTNRRKFIWLAAALIVLALAVAFFGAARPGRMQPGEALIGRLLMPVRTAVGGWIQFAERLYQSQYLYEQALEEIARLNAAIAAGDADVRAARDVLAENERLQMLLGFQQRRPDLQNPVMADVIGRGNPSFLSILHINKGERDGIAPGMAAVDASGLLVGVVASVSESFAHVQTLIDTDFRMRAVIFSSGDEGVAQGSFDYMRRGRLTLRYLPSGSGLRNGDPVLTASDSGSMIPSGLVIGEVSGVRTELTGVTEYAELTPAADLSGLRQVFVITGFG